MLLVAFWASISLINSFLAMRGMSFLEKLYFSFANSYVFFSGLGIAAVLFLASRFTPPKSEMETTQALKHWLFVCTCMTGMLICFVCIFALFYPKAANVWSNAANAMSFTNTAQVIEVPLLPAIKELMDTITPFQASLFQLILFYLCMLLYGLAYLLVLTIMKNSILAAISIYIFHIIGQYTIDTWPQWAAIIPHSYFFLQYYGEWNPFPLFSINSGAIRIIILLLLTTIAIILLNKIRTSNLVRKA